METSPGAAVRATYSRVRSVAFEIAVVLAGVVTYFGIRGLTAASPEAAVEHAMDIVDLEKALGIYHEAWLQQYVVPSDAATTLLNWVYIWGHWPVIAATLLWLALRHRTIYLRLRNAMLVSGGLGLLVYTTYPVAPPRLAGLDFVDTVSERSSAYRVLQPPAFVNQYAAMPSLHVGWDLLVGLAIVSAAGAAWLRMIGRLMPLLMAVATVATANHYLLDVLGGVAFALAGLWVALFIEQRRESRSGVPPDDMERRRRAIGETRTHQPGAGQETTTVPPALGTAEQTGHASTAYEPTGCVAAGRVPAQREPTSCDPPWTSTGDAADR